MRSQSVAEEPPSARMAPEQRDAPPPGTPVRGAPSRQPTTPLELRMPAPTTPPEVLAGPGRTTGAQVVAQSTTEATLLLRASLPAFSKLRCGCNWISERTVCNDPCCQVVAQSTTEATVLLRAVANLCPCGMLWCVLVVR